MLCVDACTSISEEMLQAQGSSPHHRKEACGHPFLSLNRWLAHSIPPAFISGRICFCSCLSSYRVGWHGRGTEAASEASAVMKSVSEAVCTNNAHARAKQRIRRDPKLPPCGK